jgi:very-short-patch-repair endonuclease
MTQRDPKATTPRLRRTPPEEGNVRHTQNYRSLPFNSALKERAKALRKAGNLSEVLLWNQLKKGQFKGFDFDRQKIIGNYIVDFYCAEKQAVIEVDGSSHDDKAEYDAQRDAFLIGLGLCVIHILDVDVKQNLGGVLDFLSGHPALVDDVSP